MRKPSNCWCVGTWKAKSLRWGCLQREGDKSLLYCKQCRHEWWSKRAYVAQVEDWTKEIRSGLTDQDIMNRILAGTLLVTESGGKVVVESITPNRGKTVLKQIEREVHPYTAYRFVQINAAGLQKKIAVHKLNWMFHNRTLVPEGFHVDHENGRGDVIGNLRLLPAAKNCATNCAPKPDQGELF
jgi:hypothetical protein